MSMPVTSMHSIASLMESNFVHFNYSTKLKLYQYHDDSLMNLMMFGFYL